MQGLGTRAFAGTMMAAAGCRLLGGLRARMVRRSARSDHQSGRSGTGSRAAERGRRMLELLGRVWSEDDGVFSGILILSARPVAQGLGA